MNGLYSRKRRKRVRRFVDGKQFRPIIHGKRKRRGAKRRIVWRRFLPALFCLALSFVGAGRLIGYLADSKATERANAELQAAYAATMETMTEATFVPNETEAPIATVTPAPTPRPGLLSEYQTIGASMLPEMSKLYAKNDDLIGWVKIPGVVDLPVVYRDNSYYLTHDFNGKRSNAGALFLDEKHPLTAKTQYLVIHGHNMHDGSMFGLLGHYRKISYIREHGIVSFSTLYREEQYVVFSVNIVPADVNAAGYIAYTGTPAFRTITQFDAFIERLRASSLYSIPIDVASSDALLTLSTCLDDERIILVCRRLRDDETAEMMLRLLAQSSKR